MTHINSGFDLNKIFEEEEKRRKTEAKQAPAKPDGKPVPKPEIKYEFIVMDFPQFWRMWGVTIPEVDARTKILAPCPYIVDIQKELLNESACLDHISWVNFCKKVGRGALERSMRQESPALFNVPNAQLFNRTMMKLYEQRSEKLYAPLIEKIKSHIGSSLNFYWLMTLSSVGYFKNHTDIVTHDVGQPNSYVITERISGDAGCIEELSASSALDALIGTPNTQLVIETYAWLTGKNTYLHRSHYEPIISDTRAVMVGCDGTNFNINVVEPRNIRAPALGMRAMRRREEK